MSELKLYMGERDFAAMTICSPRELRETFKQLTKKHPGKHFLVRLLNEKGDELMVGLGPDAGLATLTPVSRDVVYNALGNDAIAASQRVIGFDWGGHWFEMGPDNLLSPAVARQIAERWMTEGVRDDKVKWEVCGQRRKV